MKSLGYYGLKIGLYALALIPYPVFIGLGNICFFVLYYVTGYRKKVILQNLTNAFPDKTDADISKLARHYYVFLGDIIPETIKTLTFSPKAALRHCSLSPVSIALFNNYKIQNKSVLVVMGHVGNWEWASSAFSLSCRQPLYVLYRPLTNYSFNRLMINLRSRFGTRLIPMQDTLRHIINNRDIISVTTFIGDQTPPPESAYWTTFLNQDTPVFTGIEKIARRTNYPVIYAAVKRIRRGYYIIECETLCEEPALTKENEITEAHTRRLERDILAMPETWLWSHRRWKHRRQIEN